MLGLFERELKSEPLGLHQNRGSEPMIRKRFSLISTSINGKTKWEKGKQGMSRWLRRSVS